MLTDETKAVFARDLNACRSMVERGFTQQHALNMVASNERRHAAYEIRFANMIAEVSALDADSRRYVCGLLKLLGDTGCLSGTYHFASTADALNRAGVTDANRVFLHDRLWIAVHLSPPVKETTA